MKHCGGCKEDKSLDDFHRNASRKDGRSTQCKKCHAMYSEKYRQRNYVKTKAAKVALERYHLLSDDEKKVYNSNARRKGWHLKGSYGKTMEWYSETLEKQGGGCAICGRHPNLDEFLCVDHDHSCCPGEKSCGECVRGLLCRRCNFALGTLENEEFLQKGMRYLEDWLIEREQDNE